MAFKTEEGEFKGHKTIRIMSDDKHVLTLGLTKAKAILASYEDLKKFVEEHEKQKEQSTTN